MTPGTSIARASINDGPGLTCVRADDGVVGAITAQMRSGRIVGLWVVCNPGKLTHWNRQR